MELRRLGRTDMTVSTIGFGASAIGGRWGDVDDEASMRALHAGIDAGMNFIDTADVYGGGRSERLVARRRRERPGETIWVATKAGRRLPHSHRSASHTNGRISEQGKRRLQGRARRCLHSPERDRRPRSVSGVRSIRKHSLSLSNDPASGLSRS